jgi:DNA-binding transcriptional MerR regulator/methylmalonyl-CoA mutase cobalamin-binding subunit
MYTIKQASIRSGVGIPLIRAWERRYGVVSPERTASGYRLYDEVAISRLRTMRTLIDSGWVASQAAEAVMSAPDGAVGVDDDASGAGRYPADLESLVVAAERYDMAAIEHALDGLFARGSFEAVIDDLVLPAVAALGSAWASGRLDIAAEHLASEAVQRRLASLFDLAGAPGSGPAVVVGLPPGNLHEIGTVAFAIALRRRGMDVLYLGPDVPAASWVHALAVTGATAAVVGVARPADVVPAREVALALRAARPEVIVVMGGPVAVAAGEGIARALPPRVTTAAAELAALVAMTRA